MRTTFCSQRAVLLALAWSAVGTGVAACTWNLDFLDTGGLDAGPDVNAFGDANVLQERDANVLQDRGVVDVADSDGPPHVATDGAITLAPASVPDGGFPGCAELVVPLTTAGQTTDFTVNLSSNFDLTTATISVTLYAPNAVAGFIDPYVQTNGNGYPRQQLGPQPLSALASWTTISWSVPAAAAPLDVTSIYYIGLTVESGSAGATFEQPNTVIYASKIVVSGATPALGPFPFGAASDVSDSTTATLPDDTLWLNAFDQPVSGSDLVWSPACASSAGDAGPDGALTDGGVEAGSTDT